MTGKLILASGSPIRAKLLQQSGIDFEIVTAAVDEDMMKAAMLSEQAPHRDIADKLAEIKALKVSQKNPENLVLGCDQILSYDGQVFSKPKDQSDLREQLMLLKSGTHELFSAAVICQNAQPIWRFIGKARLTMRDFSETFLDNYIAENWKLVENCVGGYQIEGKGIRLFHRVEGDYFSVLGMPLLEIMNFLTVRGVIKK
ncbi:Maf family protein [Rhodobacteraceae bacterium nBUS_24]